MRWVSSLPTLPREHAEQVELERREVHRACRRRGAPASRGRSPGCRPRRAARPEARPGAAPRAGGPAAVDAAAWSWWSAPGIDAAAFSPLSPTAAARSPAHELRLSSRQTSVPDRSGRTRSRITASGGWSAASASAHLPGLGDVDGVAGRPQPRPERAQDLHLVVDDQHAGARSRRDLDLRHRERENERRPLPGVGLDPHAAAVGLDEPLHDREPEPRASHRTAPDATLERQRRSARLFGRGDTRDRGR